MNTPVRLGMTLPQKGVERWLVILRELGFCRIPHDAVVGDDSRSVKRPLLDQLSTYPPQKKANKSVEDNGRGGVSRSFHVVREFDRAAAWRCPPVSHLLRSHKILAAMGYSGAPIRPPLTVHENALVEWR